MLEYRITFHMKDGTTQIYDNIYFIEFSGTFILIQSWNGDCFTIDSKDWETFEVSQFYDILEDDE